MKSRTLAELMVDGKLPENPVQQEVEKRRWIRRRQVQSIKKKRASIGEEISERIGQTAGGTGELDTILFDKCFHKNHGRYNRKRFTALKRRRRGWLPLGGGAFVLLFVVVIMFAGAIALYGSEDEEFSPDRDIVEVAESQIGNIGGMKFWKWYGFTEPVDWCACFVSWCGEQCGYIDAEKMPKFSYCQDGANWFISHKRWCSKMISPQQGMIIFFDWDGNGVSDHVGIVKACKDGKVYTIEGNSGDVCREMRYAVGSKYILGYGSTKIG